MKKQSLKQFKSAVGVVDETHAGEYLKIGGEWKVPVSHENGGTDSGPYGNFDKSILKVFDDDNESFRTVGEQKLPDSLVYKNNNPHFLSQKMRERRDAINIRSREQKQAVEEPQKPEIQSEDTPVNEDTDLFSYASKNTNTNTQEESQLDELPVFSTEEVSEGTSPQEVKMPAKMFESQEDSEQNSEDIAFKGPVEDSNVVKAVIQNPMGRITVHYVNVTVCPDVVVCSVGNNVVDFEPAYSKNKDDFFTLELPEGDEFELYHTGNVFTAPSSGFKTYIFIKR